MSPPVAVHRAVIFDSEPMARLKHADDLFAAQSKLMF